MIDVPCTKCGGVKEGSYKKEYWCGKCIGARRKELNAEKRAAKGLPAWGSGRDPKCKQCRELKEESYKNGSLCRKCKLAKEKERYLKKRDALGLPKKRIGRNPICKCGKPKEILTESYCTACNTERKRQLRKEKALDPVYMEMKREKERKRFQECFELRIKRSCRRTTHELINKGIIIRKSCEVCGKDTAEAHHDDYSKPFDVRWLCKKHHAEHHRNETKGAN